MSENNIRNVAIIAHVDHGKTTLVDALLRQSKTKLGKEFSEESTLIMDSNDLEKERGITIFSKNASVDWNGTKINIIDTPGHADFGGEVERVLKMADGCLLLVDAKEGPMPQTKFVLKRALQLGHKIIVVINKIDKPDVRIQHVINKTFDLFLELGADEQSAYFPVIYCSSKLGKAGLEPDLQKMTDITPIFDAILEIIPAPLGNCNQPLQMLVTSISGDNFKGRIAAGRIINGQLKTGQDIMHINRAGEIKKYRLTSLMTFQGLQRVDSKEAQAGDIVAISGIPEITIGETIADVSNPQRLPLLDIEEPTVRMTFSVNTSPFAGREGEFKTSRQIQERLYKELETDVALRVEDLNGSWIVSGRGELHLAILIERMRREGFEFQVSRPQVIEKKTEEDIFTPYETVYLEVPEEYSGVVMQKMGLRHGQLQDMNTEEGIVIMEFIIATKELLGYRSEFVSDTHGLGIINTSFLEYRKDPGNIYLRDRGSLIAHENGVTKLYGLISAQDRGELFIGPAIPVYSGQVIGQNSRADDIRVNVCKEKQLTNHRSAGEGVSEHFNTPKVVSLENALEYIDDSELVEVTPKNIRIRKINLNARY
ncbi:MAG: GTP-binding protein TypA/BipA [Candidatus Daviesbacteria bacterium GW2011_GWA1_41_61]|uniref:50S ribosomal subunit assembly factor BipA n=1 Tax=Candidatus Daviesbacteria bacterium GW2011_GWA2_40_9 TaxID=1618424 RepID=A0A0G0WHK2_9BACT|nr:MAG: GTP-binding protein TypA/BipA [Candidatus Daviesbacteria bacterium GW2011_GWC1_40_9]KKR83815.1 MAG: GTP-binding protein TypA/BipA [Candidatus Daviesbacteria bacterium GW2011_GWA2_40_9]KKR93424.1 MAG: GTP-binding protein TypA/BipA [Candidatus Daviesbacteria bacterium GW2011_GWB1_41_15]KKS15027.1 MAG: GTP-binding protein TypA/BipA [Candidatus Daviesbacteria bacterium GW2011_GWA1_41_61]